MSPTPKELGIIVGVDVRVDPSLLAPGANEREVFFVKEAPAHGLNGTLRLKGKLTGTELAIGAQENVIKEIVL